jgi:hypothetical protein
MSQFKPTGATEGDQFDPQAMMGQFNRFMDSLADARDKRFSEFGNRLNEDRFNRQQVQQALSFAIARISPSASFTLAASSLAGTDMTLKDEYYRQAMSYQTDYAKFLKEKTGINPSGRIVMIMRDDNAEKPKEIDPTELPGFSFQQPAIGELFGRAFFDIGLLAFFNLIFFAGSVVAFFRYDVR